MKSVQIVKAIILLLQNLFFISSNFFFFLKNFQQHIILAKHLKQYIFVNLLCAPVLSFP